MHIKKFLEWIGLKEELHSSLQCPPLLSEGEVWWASLGENIGFEINGKSKDFTRPVLIFRKLSRHFYFVIPLTTQMHIGRRDITACLHQARSIDFRRLHRRVGELDQMDFQRIQNGFQELYLKISPPIAGRVAGKSRK